MTTRMDLGGNFTFQGTAKTVKRMGYGAMQLAGPQVWGPPRDREEAVAVLREAVGRGVNHIDTSDYYGPHADQRDHQAGASPLWRGVIGDRYKARRQEGQRQIVASCAFAARTDRWRA